MLPALRMESRGTLALGVLLVLALAFAVFLQCQVHDEVFFACDGGLKALQVKQLSRGAWHADLRLPAPAWARALWQEGFYPFGDPFVREVDGRRYVAFGFLFPLLSTPFYALLGHRGLHLIGLLSISILWWCFIRACRRLGLGVVPTSLAFFGLAFASPLTLYSAMYWEHSTAVALAFWGVATVFDRGAAKRRLIFGGLLLGLSMWLRPECACLLPPVLLISLQRSPRRQGAWLIASTTLAGLLLLALNAAIYGFPFGAHGLEVSQSATLWERLATADSTGKTLVGDFIHHHPVVLVALVILAATTLRPGVADDGLQVKLGLSLAFFLLCVPLIAPHFGGMQIGPRYLLPAAPLLWMLIAAQLRWLGRQKRWLMMVGCGGILACTGVGVLQNAYLGTRVLRHNFEYRVLPALRALREETPDAVVVTHQAIAMHLQAEFDHKIFFRMRGDAGDQRLVDGLRAAGRTAFTLIAMASYPPDPEALHALGVTCQRRGARGMFFILRCTL
jgi:hypothetical protein